MDRRLLLKNSLAGLVGLGAATRTAAAQTSAVPLMDRPPALMPIRAHADRIYDIKCCIRPFRTKGPNLAVEQIGDATVIHNYGHDGSGWCLSWGSADMQVQKAMSLSPKKIAVIGSGIIGLTSALMAQRAGAGGHHLYPRAVAAHALLSRQWRVGAGHGGAGFGSARQSGRHLGTDGPHLLEDIFAPIWAWPAIPIAWVDHYALSDTPFDAPPPPLPPMANGEERPGLLRHGRPRLATSTPNRRC